MIILIVIDHMEPAASDSIHSCKKSYYQSFWYAVYTRPHHEKKVYAFLQSEMIDSYLPLQTTVKQWSDRKKRVTEPLFTCYVFVKITPREYYSVLNIPGVIRYITFEGKAVVIPEKQIKLIKNLLEQNIDIEALPAKIGKGTKVSINAGPFYGITGELINYANSKRVVLRIEEINKVLLINIPLHYLKLVS